MKNAEKEYRWETLAGRLRFLIGDLGLKQAEFAADCGVSGNYISMLVTGRRRAISEPLSRLICQNYHVNPAWLRWGRGEPYIDEEAENAARLREELAAKAENMDSAALRMLLEVLKQKESD